MDIETFCPASRKQWRLWLAKNHCQKQAVWLVYYKKKSDTAPLSWSDAVDEAYVLDGLTAKEWPWTKKNLCSFSADEKRIVPGQKSIRKKSGSS